MVCGLTSFCVASGLRFVECRPSSFSFSESLFLLAEGEQVVSCSEPEGEHFCMPTVSMTCVPARMFARTTCSSIKAWADVHDV